MLTLNEEEAVKPKAKTKPAKVRKVFILDTNVILHDHEAIHNFDEHDIIIPITVLEEVDKFKRGNESINYQAREFVRALSDLTNDNPNFFEEGAPVGTKGGRLFISMAGDHSPRTQHAFTEHKADNRILALTEELRDSYAKEGRPVILVSKDINLRMKAKGLGLDADDYRSDKVRNLEELYTGILELDDVDPMLIDRLYADPFTLDPALLALEEPLCSHQYAVLKNGQKSVLAHYDKGLDRLQRVTKKPAYGIEGRNAEQVFALDALMRPDVKLVTITGKAGTGKTLLALAAALEQSHNYRQIFLSRPVVPLSNKDMGFLPGDIHSKLDPYIQPLYDNLGVIRSRVNPDSKEGKRLADMVEKDKLTIAPLAFIRGRSLDKVYFIVDEAQNLTPHEIKTIITRAGEGTKMVFTGDIYQIDTPYLDTQSNGLTYLVDRMKGQGLYAHINLQRGERSSLADLASDLL